MSAPRGDGRFPTTEWTLIARIKSPDDAVASRALDDLCAQYHYPLYCYLRRRGCAHHDAQDVLHDFLASVFRRRALDRLEESRGRLRGWLATSLGRHLQDWRRTEARQAPAGPPFEAGFDPEAVERRYQREHPQDHETPDRLFEREWAREILRVSLQRLAERQAARGRSPIFAILRPVLESGGSLRGHDSAALAAAAGLSEDALRAALARLLREFRDELRREVRLTVEHDDDLDGELEYLGNLFRV